MGTTHRIEIRTGNHPFDTTVEIEGRPVSALSDVVFQHRAGDLPVLRMEVLAKELTAYGVSGVEWLLGSEVFTAADVEALRADAPDPSVVASVAARLARVLGLE